MPISYISVYSPGAAPNCRIRLPESVLMRCTVRAAVVVSIIGLAAFMDGCGPRYASRESHAGDKAPETKPECPGPELPEDTIRSIGFTALRNRDPRLPTTNPSNIRINRYECNYLYTEVFAPDKVGGYITVVISPDGRVLDVLPGL